MNDTTTPAGSSAMESVVKAVVKKTPVKKPAAKKAPAKKAAPVKKLAAKKAAPAKKVAPVKKPAAKKATPAHRIDYKAGTRVKVTRRGQDAPSKGFVTRVFAGKTGHFVEVNIGTKVKPEMIQARPAMVRGF